MGEQERELFDNEISSITLRERLGMYLAKWPLFLVCIILCVSIGILYSRYTVPKFIASTSFLIKSAEGGSRNGNDLIEESLNGKVEVNLNNEILMISSFNLMERVVKKNAFNISYYKKGRLLTLNIYKNIPFLLIPKNITDSLQTIEIEVASINSNGGVFQYGAKDRRKSYNFNWNVPFIINQQSFVLEPKNQIPNEATQYVVRWEPVSTTAASFSRDLTVKSFDTKTSVIDLTLKSENFQLGKDVLNALFAEFNLSDIEDRNRLSETTVQFIDERLLNISRELKGVEGNLENYQGNNQLVNVAGQSSQSLENENLATRTIKDLSIQQGVVSMILNYFSDAANNNKLVPSSLGLNDATLASLIAQYNELKLKREREAPSVAPNSTVMQDLNTQINNLRGSILESLNNISKNLRLQENNFQERNVKYRSFLSSLPHNERVLQEIKRKQSITEGLYLYLLQKREESAISSTASNVPHYKQIDLAIGYGPVEPNTKNLITYSVILGFVLALGWVYVKSLLNDKVTSREDILKQVSSKLIGEISHIPKRKKQVISILDRNVAAEQFRSIRTNISSLLKDPTKKVVLISSTSSGEGKSFVSLNLASVFAIPGKKVALLEFDTRKPVIAKNLQIDDSRGLTDYLNGSVHHLSEIVQHIKEIPSLDIFPSGSVPSNPADLLLSQNISTLFDALRQEYDYVIVDSPPAKPVSDAFILGEYADLVLFVIRQHVTLKKQLRFINDVVKNRTFKKSGLILNDLKAGKNYGYDEYRYEQYQQESKKKTKIRLSNQ